MVDAHHMVGLDLKRNKAAGFGLQEVKVVVKGILAKRINLLQPTGVDEHSVYAVGFFLQDIEELACRGAVEITHEF
jgi:hypothetical protein